MKKLLFCITVITMMLSSMLPSYAETITYTPDADGGKVSSDAAEIKKTVLIKNAETDTIVYVNQAETGSVFEAATSFLLKKETQAEGKYTIILSGDDNLVTNTFYIGMNVDAGDTEMQKLDATEGSERWICTAELPENVGRNFKSVIIKISDNCYGFSLPDPGWQASGSMSFGVEIKMEGDYAQKTIDKVWLSEGSIDKGSNQLTYGEEKAS